MIMEQRGLFRHGKYIFKKLFSMNDKKTAVENLQKLLNAALQKGLFTDAATVIQLQNDLNMLAGELPVNNGIQKTNLEIVD